jgi:hypothetical protein
MDYWFAVVAGLLIVSGYGKLSNPAPTAGALAAAGVGTEGRIVTYLGIAEIAAASAGLLVGNGIGAIPVAVAYAGFTGFVVLALVRRWPIQSCGCFARIDTPPSWIHVVFDAAAAAGAVWQAATRAPSTVETVAGMGWWGVLYVAAVVAGIALAYRLVFALPVRLGRRSPQRA